MRTGFFKQASFIAFITAATTFSAKAQLAAGLAGISAATSVAAPLEVQLTAASSNNTNAITWQALKTIAVRRYVLEKSMDGQNFSYITAMPGKATTYTYQDELTADMTCYYRLKIVTANGSCRYSKVVSSSNTKIAATPKVLPAQLDNRLYIWMPANATVSSARILDVTGRALATPAVNNSTNLADVSLGNLAAGVYRIAITTNSGATVQLKFTRTK